MNEREREEQRRWEKASTSADHAVWVMAMDMRPDDVERAIRAGKIAFLSRVLGIPTRIMTQRYRRFRALMIEEGRLDADRCA